MAIKATFLSGLTTTSTDALHQWDYGQQLEIEASALPTIVEVHFACPGMEEAIVRPCSFINGIATVLIPDLCLEQASPITAWVFVIADSEGMTKLTITIPVEKRTRPNRSEDIPLDLVNVYTELITEINEAVEGLRTGDITASKSLTATNANTAGYAQNAGHASAADNATNATNAANANTAENSNSANFAIAAGYLKGEDGAPNFSPEAFNIHAYSGAGGGQGISELPKGLYMFAIHYQGYTGTVMMEVYWDKTWSPVFRLSDDDGNYYNCVLLCKNITDSDQMNLTLYNVATNASLPNWDNLYDYIAYRPIVLY